MATERKMSVQARFVRKSVPGSGPGDKMESTAGTWEEVVDFNESDLGNITFRLADGSARVRPSFRLTTIKRQTND